MKQIYDGSCWSKKIDHISGKEVRVRIIVQKSMYSVIIVIDKSKHFLTNYMKSMFLNNVGRGHSLTYWHKLHGQFLCLAPIKLEWKLILYLQNNNGKIFSWNWSWHLKQGDFRHEIAVFYNKNYYLLNVRRNLIFKRTFFITKAFL